MNTIRSLGYKTDLAILEFEGNVVDRGDYFFVETPDNPDFFWGNLLLMKEPPTADDHSIWIKLFKKEFSHQPKVRHMTFGWDSPEAEEGILKPFINDGFEVERSVVLIAQPEDLVLPLKHSSEVSVKTLKSDTDWEAATQNQVACRKNEFKSEKYLPFKRAQMAKYRRMCESGLGHWYGAFLNDRLVADCGLFTFDGVGRFQAVGTHPDFQRRGICGTMVHEVCKNAFDENAKTIVMVADPEYHAAKIYESVGFKATEKLIGMYRWPKNEWQSDNG